MANTIGLEGRLIRDPETRQAGQHEVCSFAVGEYAGKNQDGTYRPAPVWNCEVWGNRARYAADKLRKGTSVTVFGSVKREQWTDREGNTRDTLKVNVNDFGIPFGQDQPAEPRQAEPARDFGDEGSTSADGLPY